jgi:hypothetical protein
LDVFTIPTMENLLAATSNMERSWKSTHESGIHSAKDSFISFINTMYDYSFVFSVFPSEDKYTSLITGVMSTIAKVSMNLWEYMNYELQLTLFLLSRQLPITKELLSCFLLL